MYEGIFVLVFMFFMGLVDKIEEVILKKKGE